MPCYSRKLSRGTRWFFDGQHLNQRYFSKAIYLTKGECAKAERAKIAELDEIARNPRKTVMLFDLMNERLDILEAKNSKVYYKENKWFYSVLYKALGNVDISTVRKADINKIVSKFSSDLKKRGKTHHKANAMLRIFKALFNYGINIYELDIKNPCTGINLYSVDNKLKYIPSDEDILAVMELCDPGQKRLVQFVMETGARVNEPLSMTYGDVFDDYVVLYTRKSKNSNLMPRKVPKPDCLEGLSGKPKERVFPRWDQLPRFLGKKIKKLEQEPWGWHNLRHRYGSRLSKEGRPLFEIMSLLGHSNLETTQGYLQLLP